MSELPEIPYNIPKKKKKPKGPDNILIGFIIGLLFPLIGITLLFFFRGTGQSFSYYFGSFFAINNPQRISMASGTLSLAMISNLIPFYYFLNRKKYNTGRGIIVTMFLFAILIALYKFVWS